MSDCYDEGDPKVPGYAESMANRADERRKGYDLYTHDEGHDEGDQWQKLTNPHYWSE